MTMQCPYCGGDVHLKDSAVIYGHSYGLVYICANYPRCDAYVGVHRNTTEPLGTLANSELRAWRIRAHAAFDPLHREGYMTRTQAYELLQRLLGLPKERAHIAMLDVQQCQELIKKLQEDRNAY